MLQYPQHVSWRTLNFEKWCHMKRWGLGDSGGNLPFVGKKWKLVFKSLVIFSVSRPWPAPAAAEVQSASSAPAAAPASLQAAASELTATKNGGPPANLLINQGVRDNVSGHTTRAPPGRVRTDNQTLLSLAADEVATTCQMDIAYLVVLSVCSWGKCLNWSRSTKDQQLEACSQHKINNHLSYRNRPGPVSDSVSKSQQTTGYKSRSCRR